MKLRKLFVIFLIICAALTIMSCSRGMAGGVPGSGHIQTETRDLDAFESIAIEYPGALITIRQGDQESITIEADDNLLPQLSTDVLAGQLTIKSTSTEWKTSVSPTAQVKITIAVQDLHEIVVSAPVGDVIANQVQADTLNVLLSGGAQITLDGIQVRVLNTELSGAGTIIANGTAEEIKLLLSGVGSFDTSDLNARKATIDLTGMGSAIVRVEDELAATVTGTGSVQYYGEPHVEQKVDGAGSVKAAE